MRRDERGHIQHVIKDPAIKKQLLKEYHDNPCGGHQGHQRTLAALKLKYYWDNIKEVVINYIDTCKSCNERKSNPKDIMKVPMELSNTPHGVFEIVHIDIVGPLPITNKGNKYLLTFQDAFSKYPEAVPIPDQTAKTVAERFVTEIICKHGSLKVLVSDQGKQFMSELFV